MKQFVLGLLIVQLLLGGYQFSYTTGAGRPDSVARATRLPSPAVFGHMFLAVMALIVWIVFFVTDERPVAWITFGVLVVGASLGLLMASRTLGRPTRLPVGPGEYPDPADVTVAEQLIPRPVMALHGLAATGLLICTLLVGLGVG